MTSHAVDFRLPDWAAAHADAAPRLETPDARMAFAIETARLNVERRTGGPFAAAVFEIETGALVSLGVNIVEKTGLSLLHAETVALALAQKRAGTYDLGAMGRFELVSSAEPCAMCLGAIPWSGIVRLVTGARGEDVEAVGFDEGAKPADWVGALAARGIEVIRGVRREEAAAALRDYAAGGGLIYNPPVDRNS